MSISFCTAVYLFNRHSPGAVFFCQESSALQHTSAIFEWVYCMIIMLFYGTFAFEFGDMSADTLMVLSRGGGGGGGADGFSPPAHKADVGGGTVTENLLIL